MKCYSLSPLPLVASGLLMSFLKYHAFEDWAIAFNMCTPPPPPSRTLEILRVPGNFEAGNPQGASDFQAGNLQVPAIFRLEIRRCQ